jgi:uncharacterized protein
MSDESELRLTIKQSSSLLSLSLGRSSLAARGRRDAAALAAMIPFSEEGLFERTLRLAEQGDAEAQCYLGYMYRIGFGVDQGLCDAFKWYRRAAEQGNGDAECNLGIMYRNGIGVEQSYWEAVTWYRRAAQKGVTVAETELATMYGIAEIVTELAELGDADAQCVLGETYRTAASGEDDAEAIKWLRMSAEQNNARAQNLLGVMYQTGHGIEQNFVEAAVWYRKAAENGNAAAQANLAEMYRSGAGVNRDYREAFIWYVKAAAQDQSYAQFQVGTMYRYGVGVEGNDQEAAEWYRKAAENGEAAAQYNLGLMYESGNAQLRFASSVSEPFTGP